MKKHIPLQFILFLLCLTTLPLGLRSQPMHAMSSGEIQLGLKKLNVLGTALYVAAHPDDENTAMLAYLAKDRLVRAGYLSITRGDGGQNLIGPEQAELMGLIRTQELLQARRIDGAEQFFTRANDFGYSKSTEEALKIWGKEKVLSDVVWVIRKFQPDVIITRFPPNSNAGHGHHSGSAVLAEEAFKAAADPKRFPEQLKYVKPWQAKRIVWNSYNPNFTGGPPDSTKSYVSVNIGGYNPLLGKSYTEVAAESRSMHKSQGFGSARSRGVRLDYLTHTAGEPAKKDLFDGINLSWSRIKGGEELEKLFAQALREFRPENPSLSVPILLSAYRKMQAVPLSDQEWVQRKKEEVAHLIVACAGLWYEANAAGFVASPGADVKVNVNVVKRSDLSARLEKISFVEASKDTVPNLVLENNQAVNLPFTVTLSKSTPLSQPYWLANPHEKGMYTVNDQQLIGKPEIAPAFAVNLTFDLEGQKFSFQTPVTFKRTDPVEGEVYRPFEIRPEVSANLSDKVYVFADQQPKEVSVLLKSALAGATGEASLQLPKGWTAEPKMIPFNLKNALDEQTIRFKVSAPSEASDAVLKVWLKTKNGTFSQGIRTVEYKHIPAQALYPPAEARLVKLDIKIRGTQIGYIAGAGDEVPAALKQIGYRVNVLSASELSRDLSGFDAIVVGVRAYNTDDRLKYFRQELMDYVSAGGNLVVQYQVDRGLVTDEIGPFPFKLSRDRVTMEEAPVSFLKPSNPILNTPNKITTRDFEGWVQERGLYFAQSWDKTYEPILSSNDPGDKPMNGGLLLANYGKGTFIYTGYAFFRQLPAGVPGAYRLFANLISASGNSIGKATGSDGK
jgi:LmbE family N-acetylglucosaminyl deacetylase